MLVKQVQLLDGPGWGLPEEIKGAAALFPLGSVCNCQASTGWRPH